MYRRYYRYDDMGRMSPKFPGTYSEPESKASPPSSQPRSAIHMQATPQAGEIITPRKSRHSHPAPEEPPPPEHPPKPRTGRGLLSSLGLGNLFSGDGLGGGLVKDGLILGKFHFDDILLGFLILILMQDRENEDLMLILALGYIFLGDGSDT